MPELASRIDLETKVGRLWPILFVFLFYSFGQYGLISYFPLSTLISRGALLIFFLFVLVVFFKSPQKLKPNRLFALFFFIAVMLNGSVVNVKLNYLIVLILAFILTNEKICRSIVVNLNVVNAVFSFFMIVQVILIILDDSLLYYAKPIYWSDFQPNQIIEVEHWVQYLGFMTKERFTFFGFSNLPRFAGYLSEPSAWLLNVFLITTVSIIAQKKITIASIINIIGNLIVMSGVVQLAVVAIILVTLLGVFLPFLINFKTYIITMLSAALLVFVLLDVQNVLAWYFENSADVGSQIGSLNSKSNTIYLRLSNTQLIVREFLFSPLGTGVPFAYNSVAGLAYIMYHTGVIGGVLFALFVFRIMQKCFRLFKYENSFAMTFGLLSTCVIISFAFLLVNKGLNAFTGYIAMLCLDTILFHRIKQIDNSNNTELQTI